MVVERAERDAVAVAVGEARSSSYAVRASASSASTSSRTRSAVRARAAATPGPSSSSSTGSTARRTRTRVKPGSLVVRVVPEVEALGLAGRHGVVARQRRAAVGRSGRTARRMPASDRPPEPRARPSSTVSAWSSRVWPSSTSAAPSCSRSCSSTSYRACRAAASGPCPSPRRRPGRSPSRRRPAPPAGRPPAPPGRPSPAAVRGRRSRRPPAGRACDPRRRRPTQAPASRRRPSRRPRLRRPARGRSVSAPADAASDGGDGGVRGSRSQFSTRRIQPSGSPSSAFDGRFAGSAQTALNSSMPTLSTTARTNGRRRGTAPSWPRGRAAGAGSGRGRRSPWRRLVNFARICSTVPMTWGPTSSITTSAWPSSSDIIPVTRSRISRCAGVLNMSTMLPPLRPLLIALGDPLEPAVEQRARLDGLADRLDLGEEVVAHPRHRGELHPVRLLVEAHPEPEVGGIDAELALDVDDVGRHQEQPARRARRTGRTGRAPCWRGSRAARRPRRR